MISIPLIMTQEHPCSYLEGRMARSLYVHPSCQMTAGVYGNLLEQGFRRSGDDVYVPHCAHCSACVPARVPVASFKPDRGQRRCLKRNQNARVVIKPAVFEEEHYEMYLRYQEYKHEGGEMASAGSDEYLRFLGSSWCDTRFVEFFFQDRLGAVAVLDRFDRAWSAVYTFYEPGFAEFSPGVYAVLWQIAEARRLQIDYLYLGYWIKNCRKMSYKNKYRPLQLYIDGVWVEDSSADV